ncbi:glutathione S-transferase, partial [Phenoliferia sp. Uapishka_3]
MHNTADFLFPLFRQLELPYEVKKYSRDTKTKLAPAELNAIHPLGKSPVITIDNAGNTVTLAESGAICEFLIERYGKGKLAASSTAEANIQERADYLYWLHYAEAPFFVRPLVSGIASTVMSTFVRPRLKQNFGFVEKSLDGKQFFVGNELTGADVMMVFPAEGLEPALGYADYPNIKAWFDRISQRPAYLRALEKGAPNNIAAFTE